MPNAVSLLCFRRSLKNQLDKNECEPHKCVYYRLVPCTMCVGIFKQVMPHSHQDQCQASLWPTETTNVCWDIEGKDYGSFEIGICHSMSVNVSQLQLPDNGHSGHILVIENSFMHVWPSAITWTNEQWLRNQAQEFLCLCQSIDYINCASAVRFGWTNSGWTMGAIADQLAS